MLKGYKPGDFRDWRICLEELNEFMKGGSNAANKANIRKHSRDALLNTRYDVDTEGGLSGSGSTGEEGRDEGGVGTGEGLSGSAEEAGE
mgnify:CR=1 FL=1